MKDTFQVFPEILFIDATHKLNSLKLTLYVFLICVENGKRKNYSCVLGKSEQRAIINEMIGTLQKYNAPQTETKVIMTDKDMKHFLMQLYNSVHFMC